MASVSYGPEAVVLVLAAAGSAGLGFTVPVTIAIAVLLAFLVASYRQLIAAFPQGGGAYAVAKARLGHRAGLTAAASLVVDYILNVAVSIAAGVAALTSAVPELLPYTTWICIGILAGVTVLNLYGISYSARAFMLPTVIFVLSIATVIVAGLLRSEPLTIAQGDAIAANTTTVGVLLLLKAFSSGCAALTGVEAIANAVPSFRNPVRTAQRTEVTLGVLLGTMLLGLAVLIEKFDIHPVEGSTVLSQLAEASLGSGIPFYVVQFATVVLLALAANTSFGGLPTLLRLLADDDCLPHRFAARSPREVYRFGVLTLAVFAAILLVGAGGSMNALVPLFAIGVFVGFTLAQFGLVRHWRAIRSPGWRLRTALNGFGGVLTAVAAVVTASMKFTEGAWLIVVALPLLVLMMERVRMDYRRGDDLRRRGTTPPQPTSQDTVVIVPVSEVSELSREALGAAISMGRNLVAVHVCGEGDSARAFAKAWDAWHPDVALVMLEGPDHSVGRTIADWIRRRYTDHRVVVVIGALDPLAAWQRVLPGRRGTDLDRILTRETDAVVCHVRLRRQSVPKLPGEALLHDCGDKVAAPVEDPALGERAPEPR
ncbi:amino acid permease [Rhodococcus sp. ABRD24]|uniref:APC family permease n=1 Tax=Rhodococcus sp. ABRD24 TaxID=2507582 RepID=UPI00103D3E62|nr:APC family permease [Rhodococcus sp. ABRD24]QBJ98882.1 amino acid permease [Rhodococcus sp. ABRD24]